MTEGESEGADRKNDSSSESKDETMLMLLMLLMLDVELLESSSEGMKGSMETSCRYL